MPHATRNTAAFIMYHGPLLWLQWRLRELLLMLLLLLLVYIEIQR
jgi:hypothetical protein